MKLPGRETSTLVLLNPYSGPPPPTSHSIANCDLVNGTGCPFALRGETTLCSG
jgi:hypothetical protein